MEQHNEQPTPRKGIGPFEWIAFMVLAGLLFYFAQKMGCGPVKTEENLEWIDR